ncbi:hypothetical protein I4F81_009415 [Pyropia yezoensis]|uniref:Uncharacterized protein n=1 Tax=Pyropia yezoensis TaxID=2788 RepID=A0ACC3C9Z8_PYRYE|nr:hypothetical protein I4F81_009415 [Neopyropia yezoensis]
MPTFFPSRPRKLAGLGAFDHRSRRCRGRSWEGPRRGGRRLRGGLDSRPAGAQCDGSAGGRRSRGGACGGEGNHWRLPAAAAATARERHCLATWPCSLAATETSTACAAMQLPRAALPNTLTTRGAEGGAAAGGQTAGTGASAGRPSSTNFVHSLS